MSDRAYAKAQAQQKTLIGSSPKNSLLQRTCACGQHTIAGGECSTCRSEQSTLLRSQRAFGPSSSDQAALLLRKMFLSFSPAFDRASRFGHDFSRIPVYSSRARVLQTKLAVDLPGDEYEQEADRVADQVMAAPAHPVVNGTTPRIQRFSGHSNGQMDAAPASVDRVLASPGRPLDPTLRQDMGQRFVHDFSQVRVHADADTEQSAEQVNAYAYTVGHDIVFGAGRFAPGTHEGRRLIAHELTHVVQQTGRVVASLQCKEKESRHNWVTVKQITVESKTTGQGQGRALTSDDQTLSINIEVNNLSAGRIETGQMSVDPHWEEWSRVSIGSSSANRFVYLLPPGVTTTQTMTIVIEPASRDRQAEGKIRALPKHIRDFLTTDEGKASGQDLLSVARAGMILEKYGVTENDLLLQHQRRVDLQEVGLRQGEGADPEAWALSYVAYREQARTAEKANRNTLLETAQRLSLASLNLYQTYPPLDIIEPKSKLTAWDINYAITTKETHPMYGPSEKIETPFSDLGDLQKTLQAFESTLVSDLRAIANTLLDATEAMLIRMNRKFVGLGEPKQGSPANLERTIEDLKKDPNIIKVVKEHEEYKKAIDREDRYDYKHRHSLSSDANPIEEDSLYQERERKRQGKLEKEQQLYNEALRQVVAEKSELKLQPGFDVGNILFAQSAHTAQLNLSGFINDGRSKVQNARKKLGDPKFLYAADIIIAKEKEHLGEALGTKRSGVVNLIIDQLASERRSQTTLWEDIVNVLEFASSFVPGPIGWVIRGGVTAIRFDQKISDIGDRTDRYATGLGSDAPNPGEAWSALGEAAIQVGTDAIFLPRCKKRKATDAWTRRPELFNTTRGSRAGSQCGRTRGWRDNFGNGQRRNRCTRRGVTGQIINANHCSGRRGGPFGAKTGYRGAGRRKAIWRRSHVSTTRRATSR